jgi:pulcherriminic acid synthase
VSVRSPARTELLADFDAVVDGDRRVERHEVFARLRAGLPAFFSERLDAWVFTRYDDVKELLSSDERFGRPLDGPGAPVYGRSYLEMTGREHNKKVGIVAREIRTPRAVKEHLDAMVERITIERVDRLPFGREVDLREAYDMWVPLLAITELMGVDEAARFCEWYHAIAAGGVSSISNPGAREAAFTARDEVKEFLAPIIAERSLQPGNDLISHLVTAEYEGEPLPDGEVSAAVVFLLTAGVETTERVLTSFFRYLALDPSAWEDACSRRHDRTGLSALAAEALRMFPPVQGLVREARADEEVGGVQVRRSERVVPLLASGNRDEEHFADPQRFDPERFADNPGRQFGSAGEVLPFGAGPHHCTGSRLAEVEMAHAFEKLFDRVARISPARELPPAQGFILHSPPALPVILEPRSLD